MVRQESGTPDQGETLKSDDYMEVALCARAARKSSKIDETPTAEKQWQEFCQRSWMCRVRRSTGLSLRCRLSD